MRGYQTAADIDEAALADAVAERVADQLDAKLADLRTQLPAEVANELR